MATYRAYPQILNFGRGEGRMERREDGRREVRRGEGTGGMK